MILQFWNKTFGFIQVYAPTSAFSDNELNQVYIEVSEAIKDLSKCDWLIVMGDFNAKIGQSTYGDDDVTGSFGFGSRNDRGDKSSFNLPVNINSLSRIQCFESVHQQNTHGRSVLRRMKSISS